MVWAGANPRSSGPALDDVDHIDNPEWHTTAMVEACASANVDVLKRLKPTPTDDLASMLEHAAFSAHRDILVYLLELGANPNDRQVLTIASAVADAVAAAHQKGITHRVSRGAVSGKWGLALRVTSDGQKFLVQIGRPGQSRTLHVVFNWPQIVRAAR